MSPLISIDAKVQRFSSSAQPEPDVCVQHTTEVMAWPTYSGGGEAPHATIWPIPGQGIRVREHIPWTDYAKALMNLPGGVETNRRGVIQFELVGTCDPKHKGDPKWYFWPDADDVVLQSLADYQRPILERFSIPFTAPAFLPYPTSYGANSVRMSGAQWNAFQGICGHQHVPEQDHGDPGAFPIGKFLAFLRDGTGGFLMALTDDQQKQMFDRIMGAVPAGSAVGRKDADGGNARILDTGDGGYLVNLIRAATLNPDALADKVVSKLGGSSDVAAVKQAVKDALKEGVN